MILLITLLLYRQDISDTSCDVNIMMHYIIVKIPIPHLPETDKSKNPKLYVKSYRTSETSLGPELAGPKLELNINLSTEALILLFIEKLI